MKLDELVWEGRNLEGVGERKEIYFVKKSSKNKLLKSMFNVSINTKR